MICNKLEFYRPLLNKLLFLKTANTHKRFSGHIPTKLFFIVLKLYNYILNNFIIIMIIFKLNYFKSV